MPQINNFSFFHEYIIKPIQLSLQGAKYTWGPSALFGSVSLVSAVLTLLLPETRHLDLSEDKEENEEEMSNELQNHDDKRQVADGATNLAYTAEE